MSDYRLESIDLATGGAVENGVLELGANYRTITVTRLGGFVEVRPNQAAPWIPVYRVGQVIHLGTPTKKLYYKKAAGLTGIAEFFVSLDGSWIQLLGADAGSIGGVVPQLDDTDKQAVSLWGRVAAPGDTSVLTSPLGRLGVAIGGAVSLASDGASMPAGVYNPSDSQRPLGVAMYQYNGAGALVDAVRGNTQLTVLASAARVATTVSALLTSHNAAGLLLQLNVTVNPGGAQTLTLRVRAHNAITSVATVHATAAANAFAGAAGVTLLLIYPGATVAPPGGVASVVQSTAIPRDFDVEVVHSGAGSWTYSVHGALML